MIQPEIITLGDGLSTVRWVEKEGDGGSCFGCLGNDDVDVCIQLPGHCVMTNVIFVAAPDEEPPQLGWDKE